MVGVEGEEARAVSRALSASAIFQDCTLDLCALQNELAVLEFIHCLVETLDRYFSNVCELDLMFNLEMVEL